VSSSANSSAEPLDSEVSLLDSAKAERGTLFEIFPETIRQLMINKINFI
jgi:hypothetical protein